MIKTQVQQGALGYNEVLGLTYRLYTSFLPLCATDTVEHSLDNGDGPPCLQVKPCTPEFCQTHYQLVSSTECRRKSWEMRHPSWASELSLHTYLLCQSESQYSLVIFSERFSVLT